jgi:hypothetical protein
MHTTVNIRNLKEFATKELPIDSTLREVLLKQPDEVGVDVFLARLPIFLQLASMKTALDPPSGKSSPQGNEILTIS